MDISKRSASNLNLEIEKCQHWMPTYLYDSKKKHIYLHDAKSIEHVRKTCFLYIILVSNIIFEIVSK